MNFVLSDVGPGDYVFIVLPAVLEILRTFFASQRLADFSKIC